MVTHHHLKKLCIIGLSYFTCWLVLVRTRPQSILGSLGQRSRSHGSLLLRKNQMSPGVFKLTRPKVKVIWVTCDQVCKHFLLNILKHKALILILNKIGEGRWHNNDLVLYVRPHWICQIFIFKTMVMHTPDVKITTQSNK